MPVLASGRAQVGGGGLALQVRVGGDDHLGDLHGPCRRRSSSGDVRVLGADVIDRADRPAGHVVQPAELAGALDRLDVLGLSSTTQITV